MFELRTSYDGNIYRSIFMFRGATIIILESFVKKTQKTPIAKLTLAKERRELIDAGEIDPNGIVRH